MHLDWPIIGALLCGIALGFLVRMPPRRALPKGYVLMPLEPTDAMLKDACDDHEPGKPMGGALASYGDSSECPRFIARRRLYRNLLRHSPNWRAE